MNLYSYILYDKKEIFATKLSKKIDLFCVVLYNSFVIQMKKLDIIYEDKEFLVINKPAKKLTIATEKEKIHTLYHEASEYVKKKHKKNRIFIVHRLDRDTSGVVLFVKNEQLKFALQNNWNELALEREYLALVEGSLENSGTIRSYLKETKTLLTYSSKKKDGKLAITHYRPLCISTKQTLVKINIDTGRKNQIRVHMKDLGHPIVGDKKYGTGKDPYHRMCLHASKLKIIHPKTKKQYLFEARIPKELQQKNLP